MNRIKPAKFVHVVYRTHQFEKMIDWYCKVFDAQVQYRNEAIAFLTYDDEHHRIAIGNMDVMMPGSARDESKAVVGVDHVAYTYDSLRSLLENYAQLKEMGIVPYWKLHHGITISLYYADPDGNQMEFQVDAYDTAEAANEFMHGEGYATNPLGTEFDPDEWLAALRNGVPEATFLERKVHLPVTPFRGALFEKA